MFDSTVSGTAAYIVDCRQTTITEPIYLPLGRGLGDPDFIVHKWAITSRPSPVAPLKNQKTSHVTMIISIKSKIVKTNQKPLMSIKSGSPR
jgi:hypothetical protein